MNKRRSDAFRKYLVSVAESNIDRPSQLVSFMEQIERMSEDKLIDIVEKQQLCYNEKDGTVSAARPYAKDED